MGLPPENLINLADVLRQTGYDGPIWSTNSEQLNLNLLRLSTGDSIAEHINAEVDVVIVVFEGQGKLTVDGTPYPLRSGHVAVIPIGTTREIQCQVGPLIYMTCHQRRRGLLPS